LKRERFVQRLQKELEIYYVSNKNKQKIDVTYKVVLHTACSKFL